MVKNFRTYELAVKFYKNCEAISCAHFLKNQLQGASSSIVLNLAEGYGRVHKKDKRKFYQIAFSSFRECQSILDLLERNQSTRINEEILGAHLYKLLKALS